MTHWRLGQMDQAQPWLTKAAQEIKGDAEPKPSEGIFEPPEWEKRLILELLLSEARQLIPAQGN